MVREGRVIYLPESQMEVELLIRKHALFNAYKHKGRAEVEAVMGKVIGERPDLKAQVKDIVRSVRAIVGEVNGLSLEEQLSSLRALFPEVLEEALRPRLEGRGPPPLPNAEKGKVVTRFPPEPNGYPHIGHAKAAIIDEAYARMYEGKFILRFDDTNPAKEKLEYYQAIKEGLEWLGVKPDLVKNTSDDLEKLYSCAEKLISLGHAYVCTCNPRAIRESRAAEQECACRSEEAEAHLERWEKMFSFFSQNQAVVRLKADMKHKNTALRDPALLRILEVEHPLKGKKYRVWPTYDFATPIEDSLDGVTHALRTKEYELRDEPYFLILRLLGLRRPEVIEFSRLEMRGTPTSKRRLKQLFDEGVVEAWDDPRLPTLMALRRRGILPEAIREFVLSLGVTKTESVPTWDLLESFNRRALDPEAKRYFFVPDPVRLEVKGAPRLEARLRLHPDRDLGERAVMTKGAFYLPGEDTTKLKDGSLVRLMGLYNVKIEKNKPSKVIGVFAGYELLEGAPKLQWITEEGFEFVVMVPGPLFIEGRLNEKSMKMVKGLAEWACRSLMPGEIVQFTRFGFCRIDGPGVAILACH